MTATEPLPIEVMKIDPLKRMTLVETCSRVCITPRHANRLMAQDIVDGRPGRSFPLPAKSCTKRAMWSELEVMQWLSKK